MFKLNEKSGVIYYTSSLFEDTDAVKHCFTTRRGGVSEGCYSSMNLRSHSDDSRENVLKNFRIISDTIGIEYDRLVLSKQVHEDNVVAVTDADAGNGILFENKFSSADALVTDVSRLPIAVFMADCVPVIFYDRKRRVIAAAHSGWRGTVKRICEKTVWKMCADYNSNPEDIIAAIGPSIQSECFEVGDDVAEIFENEFGGETVIRHGKKPHVSMQTAIRIQLEDAGIPEHNIDDSGICTACNNDLLYSHRKTGFKRGNMGAFLELEG